MPVTGACYTKNPQTGEIECHSPVDESVCKAMGGFFVENHDCIAVQSSSTSAHLVAALTDAVDKAMAKDAAAARAAAADAVKALAKIATS